MINIKISIPFLKIIYLYLKKHDKDSSGEAFSLQELPERRSLQVHLSEVRKHDC
jgi:hypothetical protein